MQALYPQADGIAATPEDGNPAAEVVAASTVAVRPEFRRRWRLWACSEAVGSGGVHCFAKVEAAEPEPGSGVQSRPEAIHDCLPEVLDRNVERLPSN